MELKIYKNYQEASLACARLIAAQIRLFPDSVLGLATGSTPIACYQELIRMHKEEDLDFAQLETVNLDEYVGLAADHPQSYRYFMNEQLFNHVNIDPELTHVPQGTASDLPEEAEDYELLVEMLGGIDLQLLGLGTNGHIGFNEPDSEFPGSCHLVDLTPETIQANARFFLSPDDVPKQAITMGIGQIMKASKVILLACGANKAAALQAALTGPVTPQVPASILQFHPDCCVIADEEAVSWCFD